MFMVQISKVSQDLDVNIYMPINICFYLLNGLRSQGPNSFGLNVVFNALVISKLTYACQAFSGFLSSSDLCSMISGCCMRIVRFSL
jgi:hypothetical protein